jgi:hypothetical protein
MHRTGSLRVRHDELVRKIDTALAHLPYEARKCRRSSITKMFYELQTEFGRKWTDAYKLGKIKRFNNPGKPNAYVSGMGQKLCKVGKCCIVIGIAIEAHAVVTSQEPGKEIVRAGGRLGGATVGTWAGAWAGAKLGAGCGTCAGPWGAVVLGIAGGIGGACCGEYVIDLLLGGGSGIGCRPPWYKEGCHGQG